MYGLDELTTSSTVTSHYLNLHPQELILAHLYHPHESHYQSSKRNSQDTFTYKPPSSPFCSVYSFSYSFSSQQDSFCSHWLPVTYTMSSSKQMSLLLMTILSSFLYLSVSSFEYEIGANEGWVVPPANDTRIYNDWASENRFQVDDTIRKFTHRNEIYLFLQFPWCSSPFLVQVSSTGRTPSWRSVQRITRSATPVTPTSSPTLATLFTILTIQGISTS